MKQQGFSFCEILVSIAVISVVVLGFSLNTISVIRGNLHSASYTIAANLAQDKLEQLTAHPVLNNVEDCPASGELGISASGAPGGIFDRCWTIKDSSLGLGLKEISVTVRWKDSDVHGVTLSTMVFND